MMNMYPLTWDLVVVADDIARGERWERLNDEYTKNPSTEVQGIDAMGLHQCEQHMGAR